MGLRLSDRIQQIEDGIRQARQSLDDSVNVENETWIKQTIIELAHLGEVLEARMAHIGDVYLWDEDRELP